ncbi:SH3 domain-containing protein [Oribacterium sp. P6A1]|uniref:SH3 domain-containing protein n=1 Tax=Oribacterium sp. P6A1 TaxID=1410612 RepID=UPI00068A6B62|nr:SH3 domain-containing protein [Oribacterium sp. P6A1]
MPTPREANIWGKIRNDLSQAQQSILNGQYNQALILDKRILHTLVRMQIDRAVLVSNNLESDIDQLLENKLISDQTRDNYHAIRIMGEQAEAGETATSQSANESFSLIRDELNNYVDSFQSRPISASYASGQTAYSEFDNPSDSEYDTNYSESQISDEDSSGEDASYPEASDLSSVNIPLNRSSGGMRSGRPTRPLRDNERVSRTSGRRSSAQRNGRPGYNQNRRPKRRKGFELDLYNIMKFLIPISCAILLIILIKIINGGSSKPSIATTAAPAETTVAATEAPVDNPAETVPVQETQAVSSVWVTTTGVKVRTEPNTNCEVLEVLDAGVQVTYKGSPNDEWIMIDYNGRDAYVSKQYVQEVAQEVPAA